MVLDGRFEPLVDGTVDRVRADVEHVSFGVASLTRLDAVQSRLIATPTRSALSGRSWSPPFGPPSAHCSWREASTRDRAGWEW
jgi:hypothetical protein